MSTIGLEIRKKRKELGLTQMEVAGDYMSIAKLSNIENGKILPDPKTWEYLKGKLGLTDEFVEKKELIEEVYYTLEQAETYYKTGIIDRSKERYEQVIELAPRLLQYERFADALKNLGVIYMDQKDYKKAESLLLRAKDVYVQEQKMHGEIECYMKLGVVYHRQEKYNRSNEFFQQALSMIEKDKDSKKGTIFYSVATNHYFLDNIDLATFYCEQSLKYLLQSDADKKVLCSCLILQGILLMRGNMHLLAREKFYHAKQLALHNEQKDVLAKCWHNLAVIEMQYQHYEKAEEHFYLSIEIKEAVGDKRGLVRSMSYLTGLFQKTDRSEEALKMGLKALKLTRENQFKREEVECLGFLSGVYKNLGEEAKMLDAVYKAILLTEDLNMHNKKIEFYEFIAKYYYEIGDTARSTEHLLKALVTKLASNNNEKQPIDHLKFYFEHFNVY